MPKTYKTHEEWLAKFKEHLAAKPPKPRAAPKVDAPTLPSTVPPPVAGRQYKRFGEE